MANVTVPRREYGRLIVEMQYPTHSVFISGNVMSDYPAPYHVVRVADDLVSATAEMIRMCADEGLVERTWAVVGTLDSGLTQRERRMLTVGTEGYGLGVVRYEVREHPEGPQFVELHRIKER